MSNQYGECPAHGFGCRDCTYPGKPKLLGSESDPFDAVIEEMQAINKAKRSDYTGNEDPWANFRDSARQVGQAPGVSVEVLIGTKQARLRHLLFTGREARNEAVRDTLLDRAVYSVIALAMYDAGLYATNPQANQPASTEQEGLSSRLLTATGF